MKTKVLRINQTMILFSCMQHIGTSLYGISMYGIVDRFSNYTRQFKIQFAQESAIQ